MRFISPTYGVLTRDGLHKKVSAYMESDKNALYRIIIGSDSKKIRQDTHDFVAALIIHKVGSGGIYFWTRAITYKKIGLKERIYIEAIKSLELAEHLAGLFANNGIAKYDVEIHVDIGQKGKTKDLIQEVVGMVRGSGYIVKTKPDSFGASKVADRHT